MGYKLIKDPVHGYIKVPTDYMKRIVDTCEFQRLRNIRQTSYDSLYPGASHNRFIHSLGVFYLGRKAFQALKRNTGDLTKELSITDAGWTVLSNTFELACLLHDVGHMPFSHDGEDYLLIPEEEDDFLIMTAETGGTNRPPVKKLYNDLLRVMKKTLSEEKFETFRIDFANKIVVNRNSTAKPHEIMSVIIALETYMEVLNEYKVDVDLFARTILGIQYKTISRTKEYINNALIQLLNSSIIDVDRLDYIIRDSQMSGLDNVVIDVERLLESVTIIPNTTVSRDSNRFQFGFKKNALSIIENVVLAYDAERKWIQSHPVVIYDSFLVKQCLSAVDKHFKIRNSGQGIFQKDALTAKGITTEDGLKLRLLNDSDCIFLMKQLDENEDNYFVKEYLSRNLRKQPIWKSEAEYSLLLDQFTSDQKALFLNIFCGIGEKKDAANIGNLLDDKCINYFENELSTIENDKEFSEETRINKINTINKQLFWLRKLKHYFHGNKFEICNLKVSEFQSKINDLSNGETVSWFDSLKKSRRIDKLQVVYETNGEKMENQVLYWYIHKTEQFSITHFVEYLKKAAEECEDKYR